MMYEFPYSAILEEPNDPAPSRSRLVSNAAELFEASARSTFQPFEQLQLLSDFRRYWLLIEKVLQAELPVDVHGILEEVERRRFELSALSAAGPETWPEALS